MTPKQMRANAEAAKAKLTKAKKNRPAFVQAVVLTHFAGIKLEPMTKQREVVAAEMGLKNGFYPMRRQDFLRDVIILIWLCTIPVEAKKGWCVDDAEANPAGAMAAALVWARKMGIGISTPRFYEGLKIYNARIKEITEAKGEPDIPADAKREAPDTGEL